MSFFDDNEISSIGTVHVEAAEGYSGAIGAQLAMVEGFQNDMLMFTAALKTDIQETKMVREGAGEEKVFAMQEGALGSFWEKIKAFIRKIIAKVKGIFQGFIAKFEAWMNRDGRAFYNKYKRDIFSGKELGGLKVRYSKPKTNVADISVHIGSVALGDIGDKEQSSVVEEYLGKITTPSVKASAKEFRKEFHDACFDTEEKDYEVKTGDIAELVSYISGKKDPIAAIKKMAAEQEKGLNATLKQVEKFQSQTTDHTVDKDKNKEYDQHSSTFGKSAPGGKNVYASSGVDYQKKAASYQKQVSAMQEALGIANSAALTEIKFAVAQSRRIAAAIVAHSPKKKNEETDLLLDIEQEAAEYEVLSDLEAVG